MTAIPEVYTETLEVVDARCYGPYTFGLCTLSELLDAPASINRFGTEDYENPEWEWIEAMQDARDQFRESLRQMKQTREWEEGI